MTDDLEKLVTAVSQSAKYRHLSPDLMRRIGARELAARRAYKEAVKSTKNKLHQVGGAYFTARIDYDEALARLRQTRDDPAVFRQTCRDLMALHASTRERLPILDNFYRDILADLPPINSVIDVACGLNPLAWPWMPLAAGASYHAYDIYGDMTAFLQGFFDLLGVNGRAQTRDVIGRPPTETADIAFILKTLPCLEQVDKTAAAHLLDNLNARYLLISYPARSLGGRRKGMAENYTTHFEKLADGRRWRARRFEFETELAFLVEIG
ncbi:MAG TPA: 16S rRNA methyltransferase [Anaerolineae bacterium]|nr:16S rRNA methyltransferase [Anaerolineae bacterium]